MRIIKCVCVWESDQVSTCVCVRVCVWAWAQYHKYRIFSFEYLILSIRPTSNIRHWPIPLKQFLTHACTYYMPIALYTELFKLSHLPSPASCGLSLPPPLGNASTPSVVCCQGMRYRRSSVGSQPGCYPPSMLRSSVRERERERERMLCVNSSRHVHVHHSERGLYLTFVMVAALILPVCRTCGPRQRSIRGPHLQYKFVIYWICTNNITLLQYLLTCIQ